MFRKIKQKGFTLLEIMVVIAILGIITSIALPSYQGYMISGRLAEAYAGMASAQSRLDQYYLDNRNYGVGADGAACGVADAAAGENFAVTCVMADDGQGYLITATGANSASAFEFTLNSAGIKATTAAESGWSTSTSCWISNSGGACR